MFKYLNMGGGNEILYVRQAAKRGLVRRGPRYVYLRVTNPLNYSLYYLNMRNTLGLEV
jgi:hypothetical protein